MYKNILTVILTLIILLSIPTHALSASKSDVMNTEYLLQESNVSTEELDYALQKNLKGLGFKYVQMENETGVNAIFIAAISALESGWGTSVMAKEKNNLFGYGNITFGSREAGIETVAKALKKNYLSENGRYFKGYSTNDVAFYYCPNPEEQWGNKVANIMNDIARGVINYRETHKKEIVDIKKAVEVKEVVEKVVSAEEKVVMNYKNGNIVKEVNLILTPTSETEKEDFFTKTSVNDHANLQLYGKCENTKIKIIKIKK